MASWRTFYKPKFGNNKLVRGNIYVFVWFLFSRMEMVRCTQQVIQAHSRTTMRILSAVFAVPPSSSAVRTYPLLAEKLMMAIWTTLKWYLFCHTKLHFSIKFVLQNRFEKFVNRLAVPMETQARIRQIPSIAWQTNSIPCFLFLVYSLWYLHLQKLNHRVQNFSLLLIFIQICFLGCCWLCGKLVGYWTSVCSSPQTLWYN